MTAGQKLFVLLFVAILVMGGGARAAERGEVPLELSAEQSLEWYEDKGLYVARGAARAVRGSLVVEADLLTAHRSPTGKAIEQFTAEGNVRITDGAQSLFGQKAVYDAQTKVFTMTGQGLRYVTAQGVVVTARDSIEYRETEGLALARGRALVDRSGNRIEADIIRATLAGGDGMPKKMTKMMAQGGVVIVTKEGHVAQGQRAVYDVVHDVAILLEDVRIKQGETQLAGAKAEVDFKSGKSRLLGGSGRVRALLPGLGEQKEKAASP